MSEFLFHWDRACEAAREIGAPVALTTFIGSMTMEGKLAHPTILPLALSARTMHPSFMAAKPPKYDPARDKKD